MFQKVHKFFEVCFFLLEPCHTAEKSMFQKSFLIFQFCRTIASIGYDMFMNFLNFLKIDKPRWRAEFSPGTRALSC